LGTVGDLTSDPCSVALFLVKPVYKAALIDLLQQGDADKIFGLRAFGLGLLPGYVFDLELDALESDRASSPSASCTPHKFHQDLFLANGFSSPIRSIFVASHEARSRLSAIAAPSGGNSICFSIQTVELYVCDAQNLGAYSLVTPAIIQAANSRGGETDGGDRISFR
jgi:hypothetical protein